MVLSRLRFAAPFAIIALLLFTYGASIGNGFVEWDDRLLIIDNATAHGLTPANIIKALTTYDPELYIPLTLFGYQAIYSAVGLSPWAYHLLNLALHAGCSLCVFAIMLRLSKSHPAALMSAALFAVHPLNTEAVAWASALKDVLSGFLALCSAALWLRWRDIGLQRDYASSIALFALSLMAKVSVLGLPLVLLSIDWARGRSLKRSDAWHMAPLLALSIVFGVVALLGKGESNSGLFLEKLLIGAKATTFYMQKLLLPSGLSALYPYTKPIALTTPELAWSALVVAGVTVAALGLRNKARWWSAGWLCALFLLGPSFSNFAKGKDLLHDVYFASDRYAYLAAIPAMMAAGACIAWAAKRQARVAACIAGLVIAHLAVLASLQASTWHDSMSMFRNVLRSYPQSHVALNNVATFLYQQGDRDKALSYYQASLKVRPNSMAYFNLGVIAEESGLADRAEEFFLKALEQNPGMSEARERLVRLGKEAL